MKPFCNDFPFSIHIFNGFLVSYFTEHSKRMSYSRKLLKRAEKNFVSLNVFVFLSFYLVSHCYLEMCNSKKKSVFDHLFDWYPQSKWGKICEQFAECWKNIWLFYNRLLVGSDLDGFFMSLPFINVRESNIISLNWKTIGKSLSE